MARRAVIALCLSAAVISSGPAARGADDLAARRGVDRILAALQRGQKVAPFEKELTGYGAAAVPRLLEHLGSRDPRTKLLAAACLQYCWSPQAVKPVQACLASENPSLVRVAIAALLRNTEPDVWSEALSPLVHHRQRDIAAYVLQSLEHYRPDVPRMARLLENPGRWQYATRYLPRYHSPKLTPGTLKLLTRGTPAMKLAAVTALIHQNASDPTVRRQVTLLLGTSGAALADRAAEYLAWHGTTEDVPSLEKALARHNDPYTRASVNAAIEAIHVRDTFRRTFKAAGPPPKASRVDRPLEVYRKAVEHLTGNPGSKSWQWAFDLYREAEPFEPILLYPTFVNAAAAKARPARAELQSVLFVFGAVRKSLRPDEQNAPAERLPVATDLTVPIRGYVDPKRRSYGQLTRRGAFKGKIHVGDDVAWLDDHATVVAVGRGRVRYARRHDVLGHTVVIAHRLEDGGQICSVYGHLSPFLYVTEGQDVPAAGKIGAVGRSNTWENGGRAAHLHFAILRGDVDVAKIVTHVDSARFKRGDHSWIDPNVFFEKYRVGPAAGRPTKRAGGRPARPPEVTEPERAADQRLRTAKVYLKNGLRRKARELLQQLIKDYPDTRAAAEARKMVKTIRD